MEKPFPQWLISRGEPIVCTVFRIMHGRQSLKVVVYPLFVGIFAGKTCVCLYSFSKFDKLLDNTQTKQTAPEYELDVNCFEFNSNLVMFEESSRKYFQDKLLEDHRIHKLDVSDIIDPAIKSALYVLYELRTNFKPLHGYKFEYGESSHQWNGPSKLTYDVIANLIQAAKPILLKDNSVVRIQPPCYCIGDLHGNYRDATALAQLFRLVPATTICTCKYLFLGDYVDRGTHQIEVICFLIALKVLAPDMVFMLRGNHECSRVNGSIETYGKMSFLGQCQSQYGHKGGYDVWNMFNNLFKCLPLCAVVDNKLFCVHGGIAHELCTESLCALQLIDTFERPCDCQDPLINEMLWCDPADSSEEGLIKTKGRDGFGPSRRGKGTYIFGKDAIQTFLKNSGLRFIIRAHQSEEMGIGLRQNNRVVTVFSSSHYCGLTNCAAGLLINNGTMTAVVINGRDYVRIKDEESIKAVWANSETESFSEFSHMENLC
ncbi:serine/threonine protein phosphatase 2B catalytic subunit A2, putative [Entamoeba invadens IP1]|uniref:Serine/threonine-protein phosphatase n=1 Tax=Entamoeba invadens IP1 TaxID=370355 RepID=A0A0A1U8V4_ENTIV|nr:serine/threonine protein phosphatase 2B catalytic subunit A2, putative [Entamoeba invadens IP1]ELP91277.1 serine/threonine protein phosphatase 2B catalytic subunit A2, putative [Entamoeba invadens IP1]|eukprot:XP_004258048.1 serine/threonine protein phosphatase 2B catalytic subunit A2, putative [Entamoeba invadens IP1]